MENVEQLVKQRGRVKAKFTIFNNFLLKAEEEPENLAELPSRLEKAEQLWTEFDLIQNKIDDIEDSAEQQLERVHFEDTFHAIITKARRACITGQPLNSQNATLNAQPVFQQGQVVVRPNVKLPNIDLPKFERNYERWIPFRDLFESLIASNNNLPNVQKLHYLPSALSGEAVTLSM
ncbi:uncharacterized protein LOC113006001 [Solenopsis invicta]|uniref:uncharacterized protein LOC113006001 n=1 Tax=Solenopsis invicta TaxID=13686 RepID=UPI000E33DC19|nr:uncharacterized protein LOC113006001 [Solenopsis invicta]